MKKDILAFNAKKNDGKLSYQSESFCRIAYFNPHDVLVGVTV